jgi:DNA-binding response OmpR family regulator
LSSILIVEDDRDIAELVRHYLAKAGHTADVLESGHAVVQHVHARPPDLLILDLMLPGLDGREICRALRTSPATATLPIIMVTARAEEAERVSGLELGADDYVTKPFSPKELVARVGALLRRSGQSTPRGSPLRYGPLELDPTRHVVLDAGRSVRLTAKEFLLLQYFLEHRGRVLSRDLLLTDVWGYRYTGGTRTVDVHIRRLRDKLPLLVGALSTVKQFGYKLLESPADADAGEPPD